MTATQRGLDGAVCNILSVTGESLIGVGIYTAWTAGTGLVPLTAGALTLLAQGALCSETDIGPATGKSSIDGCSLVTNGWAILELKYDTIPNFVPSPLASIDRICSIDNIPDDPEFFNGSWGYYVTVTGRPKSDPEGGCTFTTTEFVSLGLPEALAKTTVFRLSVQEGICSGSQSPGPLMPVVPDYEYTDPETGCTLNYEFQGMVELSKGGEVSPVFLVSGGDYQSVRSGEKVGGCNVYNYIAYKRDKLGPEVPIYGEPPGGGGGQPPFPPQDGDDPFWLDAIKTALGLFIVDQLLALFNAGGGPDLLPAAEYQLVAPCNKNDEGEPETITAFLPEQNIYERLLDMQVEQLAFIQQQLSWKTPICRDHPVLLGDWVTVRFESIENSPQGTRPLRKLFRYRSQSALDLGQIAAYWENFTWNAGPVCVQHKNASWGTPQCWAANADEGKRVIRFAGLEAGIDPDVVGEWVISGSSDPRFGMPGTMQVAKVEGLDWVTSRQGPSGLPLLTVDP